jgi:hypothetical protein
MRSSIRVFGGSLMVLCVWMVLYSSAYAEEKPPTLPDAQLPTPVADTMRSPDTPFLPVGDFFKPLLADPKEPRFYLSYRVFEYRSNKTHAAVGGYGEFFGLDRHVDTGGISWQANFGGGIHAQFDLHAPSLDLLNTDYTIGFPFSFRKGRASYRLALYHQSSHLGDEYLLHNNVQRVELSYEAIEAIGSYEWKLWRMYYGGEYIVHQGPTDLKPEALHSGIEYTETHAIIGRGRLVGGWDLKSDQTHDWSLNSSIKVGLQFDSSTPNGHCIRVLAEGYKGFSSYGQFYPDRTAYAGIGRYLGFE